MFPFPHQDTAPVDAEVTFTGQGDAPVTVELSVAAATRDGTPAGDALTVSPATLTVQPGQPASATVTVDARQGEIGLYGGYLHATAGGETVAVVPIGYHKEEELHTLTVQGITRLGQPARGVNSSLQVVNVDGSSDFAADVQFGEGTATVRVPPGVYGVTGGLSSYAGDGVSADDISFVSEPEVDVHADTTVVLDATGAVPITVDTPAHEESGTRRVSLGYLRRGTGGAVVSTLWLRAEWQGIYAVPTDPVTLGEFEMFTHWRIGAPTVALEPVSPAAPLDLVTYLLPGSPPVAGDRQLRLVDAGAGSPAEFQAVDADGAIALVTFGGGVNVAEKERNAAAAGAEAVAIAYHLPGQLPAFGVSEQATIPALSLSKENGDALRALLAGGEVTLRLHGQRDTDYLYEVVYAEPDRVPEHLSYRAEPAQLATVDNAFHADTAGAVLTDTRDVWRPWQATSVVFVNDLLGPQTRTEYLNPDDSRYSQTAGPEFDRLREYITRYRAGEHREQSWVRPPGRPGVRLGSPDEAARPALRDGDRFVLQLPEWVDADGHYGDRGGVDTSTFRLFQDGALIAQAARARGQFPVSADPAQYRLELDVARVADWWLTSTATRTAWTVGSQRPAGGAESLPLLLVDYRL
ncbi:MAG: PA domain-containing protein, partial [Natronosporangium sp.]